MTLDEQKLFSYVIKTNNWSIIEEADFSADDFESVVCYSKFYDKDRKQEAEFDKEFYKYLYDWNLNYGKLPNTEDIYLKVDGKGESGVPYFEIVDVRNYSKDELVGRLREQSQFIIMANAVRYVTNLYNSNQTMVNSQKIDVIAEKFQDALNFYKKAKQFSYSSNFTAGLLNLYYERKDPFQAGKHFYFTGMDDLDFVFRGWDKDSDYVTVAGRPGTGKSMILTMFAAKQLLDGKRVAFYSGEMPEKQVVERIISCITGLSLSKIYHGTLDPLEEQSYVNFIKGKLCNFKLFILTPEHLGNKYANCRNLETFCNKTDADILFIDQQSLMDDLDHAKIQFEKAANISRQIKAMRDKLNIPVITAVQLNRTKTENGESDTVQIAGSDVIAQDSTKVIILAKEIIDGSTYIALTIAKNRSGPAYGKFLYQPDFEFCNFNKDSIKVFKFHEINKNIETKQIEIEGNYFNES